MVNQINSSPKFEQINFYPLDVNTFEPPEIIIKPETDSNFRINQIMKYHEYLSTEISKRQIIVARFKNLDMVCFILELLVVLIDIIMGVMGVIFVHLQGKTSIACLIATTIASFIRGSTKKVMNKYETQQALLVLAKSKLNMCKDQYEIAIMDGEVTHEEFLRIVDEFKKYESMRRLILNPSVPSIA